MRRYDIVTGILLIISTIDFKFALAAPLSVQEKRQGFVDVAHIALKDVIAALGKRGDEELGELGEEYLKTWGNPVESSGTHASSSSAPSGPDHGSTNVVEAPAPNPASSIANPDSLMEPSSCSSSTSSMHARGNCIANFIAVLEDPAYQGFDMSNIHGRPLLQESLLNPFVPPPNPKPWPVADPDFDWMHWMNADDPPPAEAHWYQVDPMNPPSTSGHAPGPPPTEPENEVVTPPSLDLGSPKEPEGEVGHGPPPSPELTDPEHQSSSTDSQPVDLQAAIYAAKGKAKESRSNLVSKSV
ncbi:hypothetical protein F5888DRAFT_1892057 [Russula emetica]|nr:hypothetical protein F5888DRAFT_1892057 [Russula emetica]